MTLVTKCVKAFPVEIRGEFKAIHGISHAKAGAAILIFLVTKVKKKPLTGGGGGRM
ncbi:MAG: hypothetical protein H7841_15365 [Magnetospirillum sp. WYHS-4]